MSTQLEVVTTVPSVTSNMSQLQYLTKQRLELKFPMLDDDEMSGHFFTTGLEDEDAGYIQISKMIPTLMTYSKITSSWTQMHFI